MIDECRVASHHPYMDPDADIAAPGWRHRQDPAVPAFADTGPVTVMDAHCALCARGARWIARNDQAGEFRIIPVQSALGHALLTHYGLNPADPASWLYLEDGQPYTSMDAVIRVGTRLGSIWRGLQALRILPGPVRRALYRLVARNRYRLFGHADLCHLPDPDVQKRLLQ